MQFDLIPIEKIDSYNTTGEIVYDLEVENNHSFCVEDEIVVHNSACTTRFETGIYRPMVSTLMEVYENKIGDAIVISDGGIKTPADMNKALMWSDITMLGGVFAQCPQSPARVVKIDGRLKKVFRGAASYSTQLDYKGEKPTYVEGMEYLVDLGPSINSVIQRFINGLRSSMSYLNAKTLDEYRNNALICIV